MEFIYRESISAADYNTLREAVQWGRLVDEQAQQGLEHSVYIVSCYNDKKIVGCARIIWDRGYIAYLADVIVIPEYQRMGIGNHMVEMALEFMKSQLKMGWKIKIVLMSAKDKEPFYEKFGFNKRPNDSAGAGMDLWMIS